MEGLRDFEVHHFFFLAILKQIVLNPNKQLQQNLNVEIGH